MFKITKNQNLEAISKSSLPKSQLIEMMGYGENSETVTQTDDAYFVSETKATTRIYLTYLGVQFEEIKVSDPAFAAAAPAPETKPYSFQNVMPSRESLSDDAIAAMKKDIAGLTHDELKDEVVRAVRNVARTRRQVNVVMNEQSGAFSSADKVKYLAGREKAKYYLALIEEEIGNREWRNLGNPPLFPVVTGLQPSAKDPIIPAPPAKHLVAVVRADAVAKLGEPAVRSLEAEYTQFVGETAIPAKVNFIVDDEKFLALTGLFAENDIAAETKLFN
jgi:hypothetical protein